MHDIALIVRGCAARTWIWPNIALSLQEVLQPRELLCVWTLFPQMKSNHRHCLRIPWVLLISEQLLHFMVLQRQASGRPIHLNDVIPRVEAQRREGLNAGGQLAILEGAQAAAQVGCQCAQAAALWMKPPCLVAREHQGYTLQKDISDSQKAQAAPSPPPN